MLRVRTLVQIVFNDSKASLLEAGVNYAVLVGKDVRCSAVLPLASLQWRDTDGTMTVNAVLAGDFRVMVVGAFVVHDAPRFCQVRLRRRCRR